MSKFIDISGKEFNSLTVLCLSEKKGKHLKWKCKCVCGSIVSIRADSLKSGHTVSCGCVGKRCLSEGRYKHNGVGTRCYRIWQNMKERCTNPKNNSYHSYGGRGIFVCEEWLESFEKFRSDMGEPPEKYSLDRIDTNGGYTKNNCRWASNFDQARNRRDNINITWDGETKILEDWAVHLGMNVHTLYARVVRYKWSIEESFNRPVQKGHGKKREVTL